MPKTEHRARYVGKQTLLHEYESPLSKQILGLATAGKAHVQLIILLMSILPVSQNIMVHLHGMQPSVTLLVAPVFGRCIINKINIISPGP